METTTLKKMICGCTNFTQMDGRVKIDYDFRRVTEKGCVREQGSEVVTDDEFIELCEQYHDFHYEKWTEQDDKDENVLWHEVMGKDGRTLHTSFGDEVRLEWPPKGLCSCICGVFATINGYRRLMSYNHLVNWYLKGHLN